MNRKSTREKEKEEKEKSGVVAVATLAISALTLVVTGFSAWQGTRLDKIEAQIAEARARSEVIHRLFIIDEVQSCAAEMRFIVQTNSIWQEFRAETCPLADRRERLAGLILEQSGKEELFAPRVSFTFSRQAVREQVLVSEFDVAAPKPESVLLSFIEEGMARPIFIPVATLDSDGRIVSSSALWPLSLNWQSPVTGEDVTVKLNWFAPQDQWLSDEAGIMGQ